MDELHAISLETKILYEQYQKSVEKLHDARIKLRDTCSHPSRIDSRFPICDICYGLIESKQSRGN